MSMHGESVANTKADQLLSRIMQGFEALDALDDEQFEPDLIGDLQVIMAYMDFADRMQLIELLMKKSNGSILKLFSESGNSQHNPDADISQTILQSFRLYQQQQTFNAVFAPESVDHVCTILSEGY